MTTPITLTDEQFAMLKRLEAETTRFNDIEQLRTNALAIEGAKKLIDEAVALKMPTQAYHGLQIWVNLYNIDKDLPQS